MNLKDSVDFLIQEARIKEMIIVMPSGRNFHRGNHYVNSAGTGNWEDFIVKDLVTFIDSNYRTIPSATNRGVAGHSMGVRGALYIAMRNPETFSAVYGMSSGQMNFIESSPQQNFEWWSNVYELEELDDSVSGLIRMVGMSAAFSPNIDNPPFFVDFPYRPENGQVIPNQETIQKWSAFDPIAMVSSHKENLAKLKAIQFDCGTSDSLIIDNQKFSELLTEAGINHTYLEYDGNHGNRIRERIENYVLPFFSEVFGN